MRYKKGDKVPSGALIGNAFLIAKLKAESKAREEYQAKKKQQTPDEPAAKK